MEVRCYWNLHKKCWSIQERTPKGWRVVRHTDNLRLASPRFQVSSAGRTRCLQQRRKNVHAFVYGTEISMIAWFLVLGQHLANGIKTKMCKVTYNPHKDTGFVDDTADRPLLSSMNLDLSRSIIRLDITPEGKPEAFMYAAPGL